MPTHTARNQNSQDLSSWTANSAMGAVGHDADTDQRAVLILGRQPAKQQGAGKSHDLGQQQRQQQCRGSKSQGTAESRRHVDDHVHAINIEEKRDEEQENLPFTTDLLEYPEQPPEALCHRMGFLGS